MNNQPTTSPEPITLESIVQQKEALKAKITEQKQTMGQLTKEIFAPATPATPQPNSWLRVFNTGMAAFDGIMMGVKIMRKIRKLFR